LLLCEIRIAVVFAQIIIKLDEAWNIAFLLRGIELELIVIHNSWRWVLSIINLIEVINFYKN